MQWRPPYERVMTTLIGALPHETEGAANARRAASAAERWPRCRRPLGPDGNPNVLHAVTTPRNGYPMPPHLVDLFSVHSCTHHLCTPFPATPSQNTNRNQRSHCGDNDLCLYGVGAGGIHDGLEQTPRTEKGGIESEFLDAVTACSKFAITGAPSRCARPTEWSAMRRSRSATWPARLLNGGWLRTQSGASVPYNLFGFETFWRPLSEGGPRGPPFWDALLDRSFLVPPCGRPFASSGPTLLA